MKRKKGLLWCVGVLLVGMVSAAPAMASLTSTSESLGTGNWIWDGAGPGFAYDLKISDTIGTAKNFSLINLDGSESLSLIRQGIVGGLFNVEQLEDKSYEASILYSLPLPPFPGTGIAPVSMGIAPASAINLGSAPQFRFIFSDSSGEFSTYEAVRLSTNSYMLNNEETGMGISFQSLNATPSSVPLPGSVLLFGSSLLGLLGIGSRKNKA